MKPFAPDTPLGRLMTAPMRPGRLDWIGLRPARRAAVLVAEQATLIAGRGIDGDRYRTSTNGARQVTLVAAEDLVAIAAFLGRDDVAPELLRRNFVIRGVNLVALKGQRFRIGAALLEGAGDCAPCSRMEETLGPGGYNAVRGRGGLTARVIEGGVVRIGDALERV
ncbi:MOSC [Rhodopseudomonas palustris HaA2]|uniref:MOSC n=1 Tax=Rhodopseudomonas palustris (strain HaA2) TaxID=316058 RepID=Q2IX39_RHOP2|nr:MOSC domain-containing protein [Rhodopseudomonas palustris]ABD07221.1 MOSC [Rhodopseudomonas palustris HaA2]